MVRSVFAPPVKINSVRKNNLMPDLAYRICQSFIILQLFMFLSVSFLLLCGLSLFSLVLSFWPHCCFILVPVCVLIPIVTIGFVFNTSPGRSGVWVGSPAYLLNETR